ncbi:LpqB family beta-propeller domain-containing protein [Nocardioides limicola]|uniref:LpqB family beta-propeller domain-containing protein n=1 Tax=Nocardioides limicola TaxID=2803368 RepID=UPI00193C010F|nr:LpqB family beta-propeller domain-containing protein [Nocardioides sp. DJM-14]
MRSDGIRAALIVSVLLLTAGCVQLPVSGPVVESPVEVEANGPDAVIVPNPPQPGESPSAVVTGFLEAMQASPVQTSIARQFLSGRARSQWRPEQATVIYGQITPPTGAAEVQVTVRGAHRLDERGAWLGAVPSTGSQITFPMVREDDEWRIDAAPDALLVPRSWFEQRFTQVDLYFFDPTGQVLIPEPVFVPRGDQLATALTRSLLHGPGEGLVDVARSFFPEGAELGLSVPVSAGGTAEVALTGEFERPNAEVAALMSAQLAWTLRQDPAIRGIRITVNSESVPAPDGAPEFRMTHGEEYAPTIAGASSRMFGLRDGRVVEVLRTGVIGTGGPLGRADAPRQRELAVDLDARRVAGVSRNGRVLRVASITDPVAAPESALTGTDLLRPAWDSDGRLWTIDRAPGGAAVSVITAAGPQPLQVRGVSGENVTAFLVSRDGSRLVAVVRRPAGDSLVVSRIRRDERGAVVGAGPATVIAWDVDTPLDVQHLAWRTASSVVVVNARSDQLTEIRTIPVDGSHGRSREALVLRRDRVLGYAGSPVESDRRYLLTDDGVIDLDDREPLPFDDELDALAFVG